MPTQRKIDQVADLKDRLSRCSIAVATNPTGLSANDMNVLRSQLRERDVEYRIVKNTLLYIAADELDRAQIKEVAQGPTGLAIGYDDPRDVAQALGAFLQSTRLPLTIQGALLNERPLTPEDVTALADLPPREEIIAKLLGQMNSPVTRLVSQMNAPIAGLVNVLSGSLRGLNSVLQQRIQQLENENS